MFILRVLSANCVPLVYSSLAEQRDGALKELSYLVFGVPGATALSKGAKGALAKRGVLPLEETDASVRDKISTALLPKIHDYLDISAVHAKIERVSGSGSNALGARACGSDGAGQWRGESRAVAAYRPTHEPSRVLGARALGCHCHRPR